MDTGEKRGTATFPLHLGSSPQYRTIPGLEFLAAKSLALPIMF